MNISITLHYGLPFLLAHPEKLGPVMGKRLWSSDTSVELGPACWDDTLNMPPALGESHARLADPAG